MISSFKSDWQTLGHNKIKEYLLGSLGQDKLSQAYLFVGPKQIGKLKIALHFINAIICYKHDRNKKIIPCLKCSNCRKFSENRYPDMLMIVKEEGARNININQVRTLKHRLSFRSFDSGYKFAVIPNADQLSLEAGNSFLKTLEEPTINTIMFLITEKPEKLPKTIVSRCQIIRFYRLSNQIITEHLISKGISVDLAKNVAYLSQGKPVLAEKLAYNPELLGKFEAISQVLLMLMKSDISDRISQSKNYLNGGSVHENHTDLKDVFEIWESLTRDFLFLKLGLDEHITFVFLKNKIKNLVRHKKISDIIKLLKILIISQLNLDRNINPRMTLENFMLYL